MPPYMVEIGNAEVDTDRYATHVLIGIPDAPDRVELICLECKKQHPENTFEYTVWGGDGLQFTFTLRALIRHEIEKHNARLTIVR